MISARRRPGYLYAEGVHKPGAGGFLDTMEFTIFQNHRDKGTDCYLSLDWAGVLSHLTTHTERVDKVGPGFAPSKFLHTPCECGKHHCTGMRGHAINANVVETYMMPIDLDRGIDGHDLTEDEARRHLQTIKDTGLAFVAHTSHSYAPPLSSKWHVFLPFSRPVKPDEYRKVWKAAIKWLGVPTGIKTDFAARFWNSPSCPPGAPRDVVTQAGPHLDVDMLLALAALEPPEPERQDLDDATEYGPAPEDMISTVCDHLDTLGEAIEGQGGDPKTYAAARILVNDWALSESEAWPIFEAWNNTQCKPPWDREGLEHKMNMALSDAPTNRGERREGWLYLQSLNTITAPKPGSFEESLLEARRLWESAMQIGDAKPDISPMFERATDFVLREFPKTPWLIQGIATTGGVGTVSTEPKAGKTWVATEFCIAVASGTKCFGEFETMKGSAAYFYAEDQGAAVKNRVQALCKSRGGVPEDLYLQPRGRELNVCDDASVILLLASAMQIPDLKILVLDPLRDVHTGAEDSSDEMSQVMKRLRVLSGLLSCTVLFVHHTAKGGADVNHRRHGQRMRGSGAMHGALDWGFFLFDTDTSDKSLIVNTCATEVKGAASAPTFRLTLDVTDDPVTHTAIAAKWTVAEPTEDIDDEGVSEVVNVIGAALMRHEDPPMEREIHKAIGGARGAVSKAIAAADALGYITKNKIGAVSRGWVLTTQGHALFNGMNAAAHTGSGVQ